jgi:thiamine biosynthesis protein ThiI
MPEMDELLIVRLGELTIKKENRARFERNLLQRIHTILTTIPSAYTRFEFGRVYIHGIPCDLQMEIVNRIQRVFGVHSISIATSCPLVTTEIEQVAISVLHKSQISQSQQTTSFKISVKRMNKKYSQDSPTITRLLAAPILQQFPWVKVDVQRPQETLHVEIREQSIYFFLASQTFAAAGGLPIGSSGSGLALLSGGIDSPVASWLALRKGLSLELVYFHAYPYTSEQAKEKVIALARQLATYAGPLHMHIVSITQVQEYLRVISQERLIVTMLRRAMMRIASTIATERQLDVLITGDSLGQVASQTLSSLQVIERAASLPVFRPLLMMDKQEIIERAEQIGTFVTSQLPYEDCCSLFVPKNPSTNPNLQVVLETEQRHKRLQTLIDEAVTNRQILSVQALSPEKKQAFHELL